MDPIINGARNFMMRDACEVERYMKSLGHLLLLPCLLAAILIGSSGITYAEDARLALRGYDPVAYFTERRPMVGDPDRQHEWDGAIYRFASARHLELFKADPDRYLPQFANWCAATVARGAKLRGNPEYWIVVDGRLYLFGGPDGPDRMRADPAMKTRAEENWPKVSKLPDPAN